MKRFFAVICALTLCCSLLISCSEKNALQISASDIEKAELIVMPSDMDRRYQLIDESDYDKIIELLSKVPNKALSNHEMLNGRVALLYLTLTDGTVHTFGNNGYIVIDDKQYEMNDEFLSLWREYGFDSGNAEIPDEFRSIERNQP